MTDEPDEGGATQPGEGPTQPGEGPTQPGEGPTVSDVGAQPDEGATGIAQDPAAPTSSRRARGGRPTGSAGRRRAGAPVRATDLGVRPGDPPGIDAPTAVDEGPRGQATTPVDAAGAGAVATSEVDDAVAASAAEDARGAARIDASRSGACPLLRRLDDDGRLGEAGFTADSWHRCTAETPPSPLADQQQALVCLTDAHVDCPRYRRAAAPVPVPHRAPVSRAGLSPATVAATVVLLMSFLAALSFVAVNGGIGVPTPLPSDDVAVVSPRPSVVASPDASPEASQIPDSPSPLPSAEGQSPTALASPQPSTTPVTTPRPSTSVAPSGTSDRYRLLVACADKPDCYVYTVRRGDNLTSIGLYFGVPFDTILKLNRWITDPTTIRPGDDIILPPPTR